MQVMILTIRISTPKILLIHHLRFPQRPTDLHVARVRWTRLNEKPSVKLTLPYDYAMRSFTTLLPGLVMLESRWFAPWVG